MVMGGSRNRAARIPQAATPDTLVGAKVISPLSITCLARQRDEQQQTPRRRPPHVTTMAPPLFDDYQIANAMRNEAVPALERLAENASSLDRDLRRFDRASPVRVVH